METTTTATNATSTTSTTCNELVGEQKVETTVQVAPVEIHPTVSEDKEETDESETEPLPFALGTRIRRVFAMDDGSFQAFDATLKAFEEVDGENGFFYLAVYDTENGAEEDDGEEEADKEHLTVAVVKRLLREEENGKLQELLEPLGEPPIALDTFIQGIMLDQAEYDKTGKKKTILVDGSLKTYEKVVSELGLVDICFKAVYENGVEEHLTANQVIRRLRDMETGKLLRRRNEARMLEEDEEDLTDEKKDEEDASVGSNCTTKDTSVVSGESEDDASTPANNSGDSKEHRSNTIGLKKVKAVFSDESADEFSDEEFKLNDKGEDVGHKAKTTKKKSKSKRSKNKKQPRTDLKSKAKKEESDDDSDGNISNNDEQGDVRKRKAEEILAETKKAKTETEEE